MANQSAQYWINVAKADLRKAAEEKKSEPSIQEQKAELRSKGLPVSVREDRATPTRAGQIVRDLIKPVATIAVRPGQALAAASGMKEKDQTVKSAYLGDIETSKSGKDVIKDVGRAIETVSYGIGGGAVAKGLKGSAAIKAVMKEGAVAGGAGSFGNSVGRGDSAKQTVINTAIGTVAGAGLAGLTTRLGNALKPNKPITKEAQKLIDEARADITKTVDETSQPSVRRGTQPNPMNAEKVDYEPYIPDDQLPVIQMGSKPKSPLPVIKAGDRAPAAPGYRYEPVRESTMSVTLPKPGAKVSTPKIAKETASAPLGKTVTKEGNIAPKVQISPEKVSTAKATLRSAYKDMPEQMTSGKLDEVAENTATLVENDYDRALRIALGKELPRESDKVTADAVYRIISADADGELALKLAQSPVPSRSGFALVTNKLGEKGSIVDKMRELNATLTKKLPPAEAKKALTELRDEFMRVAPTRKQLDELLDEITC